MEVAALDLETELAVVTAERDALRCAIDAAHESYAAMNEQLRLVVRGVELLGGRVEPRPLALSYGEAAEALGVSVEHFKRHVLPRVRVVPIGRRVVVRVVDLEAFLERQVTRV
jgi:hypothetical protein